jgi:hypothetical protein
LAGERTTDTALLSLLSVVRSKRNRHRLPDTDRVLAGQEPVSIDQLFELIHRINPTGLDLASAEQDAAYATKARLQSLMIERFGEQLRVSQITNAEGVIGLHHRTYNKDACHAVVAQLSAGARSWVRWQLDTAEDTPPRTQPSPAAERRKAVPQHPIDDHLAHGERLLADYDFEGAKHLFRLALQASDAAERVRAAQCMLTLLVEHLAADAEAVAVQEQLDGEQCQDPQVRCLLALALARLGQHSASARMLGSLEGERAEAAAAELARVALATDELDVCERWAARVPPESPSRSSVNSYLLAVRERRVAASKPLEQLLLAARFSDDEMRMATLARELITLNPANAMARATLTELHIAQRQRDLAQQVGRVRSFLDLGDTNNARAAHSALPSDEPTHAELLAAIVAAEADAASRARDEQVQAVVSRLDTGIDEAAVAALWECDAVAAEMVRAKVVSPAAKWLCMFPPERIRTPPSSIAAALHALVSSQACSDPERAVEIIANHAPIIGRITPGKAWLQHLNAVVLEQRQGRARTALRGAENMAAQSPVESLALLRAIDARHLDLADRRQHAKMVVEIGHRCAVAEAIQRVQAAIGTRDPFSARNAAVALSTLEDCPAHRAQADALELDLQCQWIEATSSGDANLTELLGPSMSQRCIGAAQGLADGIVIADQIAGRIFVREVHRDPDNNRSWVLTPTEPFEFLHAHVQGDLLWLTSRQSILHFDRRGGRVLDLWRFAALGKVRNVESALPIPGTNKIWVMTQDGAWLVDGPRWTAERRIDDCQSLFPMWGGSEPSVIYSRHLVDYVSANALGHSIRRYADTHLFVGATSRPCGNGAAILRKVWTGQHQAPVLRLGAILPHGPGFGEIDLGLTAANGHASLVSSKLENRVFVVAHLLESGLTLMCVEASPRGVSESWRISAPGPIALFGDAEGHAAHALVCLGTRVQILRLTAEPPTSAMTWHNALGTWGPDTSADAAPRLESILDSNWLAPDLAERTAACRDLLPMLSAGELHERTSKLLAADLDLTSLAALHRSGALASQDEALARHLNPQRSSAHAVLCAEVNARAGRFVQALSCLEFAADRLSDAVTRQHVHYLRALCHLAAGDEAAARTELALAKATHHDDRDARALREWLDLLNTGRAPTPEWRRAAALYGRLTTADLHLLNGNWGEACDLLDEPQTWLQEDLQAISRLAAAWLELAVEEPRGEVRKRRVLAAFIKLAANARPRLDLLWGQKQWPAERLAALLVRARNWLGPFDEGAVITKNAGRARTETSDPVLALASSRSVPEGPVSIRLLGKPELKTAFDTFVAPLCAQAGACWDKGLPLRLMGLAIPASQSGASALGWAGETLLDTSQEGEHVLIALPLAAAIRRFARWPIIISALLRRTLFEGSNTQFPLALVRDGEIGLGNITR